MSPLRGCICECRFESEPCSRIPRNRGLAFVYAATIFVSAFLLFQIQPMISKAILPWFGGTPAVWTICLLFFQSLLFAGYAYAHFTNAWLRPRQQAMLHILRDHRRPRARCDVLPDSSLQPRGDADPTKAILTILASRSACRTSSSPPPARCCKPGSPARSPAAHRTGSTHYRTSARCSRC